MASTPTATPPPANSSTSAPPPANSSTSAPPATNSSASGTSPPPQPSPLPVSPPPSPSPPANAPPPPPPSPTSTQPPPSPPPPNSTSFSSSSASPPPPKSGDASTSPPLMPSKSLSPPAPPPPPPPRSPSHSLPSHKTPSSANDADTSSENRHSGNSGQSDVSLQIIIGVTTGIGILLLMMIVASVLCCSEKKKKKKKPMDYYGALGPNGAGGYYGGGSLSKWPNADQRTDYPGNLPRPPGAAGFSPYPNALPPPQMYSGESSTNSGPHGSGGAAAMQALSPPLGFSKSSFTYDALATATNGFALENILGQGGFGFVYKGVLPNGLVVAVKQLKSGSGQGEREFQAEVEIISRVHHRHLVSLVGYCIAGSQRLLVYEFVTNNTLEHHLHVKEAPALDWPTRLKIAIGSAKGLAYLHEDCHPRIIHRDIKTANILLDNNFEAMVADFGLAKFNSDTNTHVSTRIMGTFGYLAPEYASTGKLTEKSDVFSFGVMLLELITGRRPVDPTGYMEDSLADWSRPLITQALADKNFDELVDQRLENKFNVEEMTRMIASAGACVRHSARKRPKMSQIVRALEGDVSLDDLNEATKAAGLHSSSSDFDSSDAYSSKMKGFRLAALESNEYGSNEYSGGTSEYGLNPSESSNSNSNSSGEVNSSRRTANRSSS